MGRQKIQVDLNLLQTYLDSNVTKTDISKLLKISRPTLRLIINNGGVTPKSWSRISDDELDIQVREALLMLPFIGERMILGFISAKSIKVQRYRVRQAIARIDPDGVIQRRERLHTRIRRRVYSVPHAHYMWHIDGNHKLIRWKLVVHAAIDGYSRMCLFLQCSDNNKSDTVLSYFENAVRTFNVIPSNIRTDHGGENVLVWRAMLEANQGSNQPVVLVGASVHNQRVERFNRDINISIRQFYGSIFYSLENKGLLDVDNKFDIFALHYVFIPRINSTLNVLRDCHNNHKIRTENNMTPQQLLATSPVAASANTNNGYSVPPPSTHDLPMNDFTAQATPPIPLINDSQNLLSQQDMNHLLDCVPPLTDDDDQGMTVYTAVREYVYKCAVDHANASS